MKRFILGTGLGLVVSAALIPGQASAQHGKGNTSHGGGGFFRGGSSAGQVMNTRQFHGNTTQYHAGQQFHGSQNSSNGSAIGMNHAGATTATTVPAHNSNYHYAGSGNGGAGTTVPLRRSVGNSASSSQLSAPGPTGTTVSLERGRGNAVSLMNTGRTGATAGTATAGASASVGRPTAMGTSSTSGSAGKGLATTVRPIGINGGGLGLVDPGQATTLNNFANSQLGQATMTSNEIQVIRQIANNQPLTPQQMGIAVDLLGRINNPALAPVRQGIAQGVLDNIAAAAANGNGTTNNPSVAGGNTNGSPNNPGSPGILGALAQALQGIAQNGGLGSGLGNGLGGLGGPNGGGPGFAGGGSSVVASGGPAIGDPGVSDGPVVQAPTYPTYPSAGGSSGDQGTVTQVAGTDQPGTQAVRQYRRYLRVKNDSDSKLTVFVQYSALMDNNAFQWFPAPPGGDQAVGLTIEPGATIDLNHDGWRVKADRVRIWAVTDNNNEVSDFRDQDLWLVADQNGDRSYMASDIETFTFTFGR
jgi:hypothetical protein